MQIENKDEYEEKELDEWLFNTFKFTALHQKYQVLKPWNDHYLIKACLHCAPKLRKTGGW